MRLPDLRMISRLVLAGVVVIILVAAAWGLLLPAGHNQPILITIAPGESVSLVASELAQKGLIRNADLFAAATYVTGKWRNIQAGRFELTPTMTPLEILDALCRGRRKAWRWLTVPEGYTIRQIAKELEDRKLASAEDFLLKAGFPESFDPSFPYPSGSLEGYLFPDTYRVDIGETPDQIIGQMLRRFDHVVWQQLFRGKPKYRGRTLNEIIILASLVEGEAKRAEERPIIAGVLMNRLKRGIKLECDATVQYALGDSRKSRLIHEDLQTPSDYNTYQHVGLPPGPICNPGEASVRAAMEPAKVPYLYYVARPDGSHMFSATFAQHQEAIAQVHRAIKE